MLKKILDRIKKHLLLTRIVGSLILIVVVIVLIIGFLSFIETRVGLELYQLILFVGLILALIWSNEIHVKNILKKILNLIAKHLLCMFLGVPVIMITLRILISNSEDFQETDVELKFYRLILFICLILAFVWSNRITIKNMFKEISDRIEEHLLPISIILPLLIIALRVFIPNFECFIETHFGLEFYQLILFVGAILTLIWSNKRYKQGEKRYQQAEKSIFLNKMNSIYLEVVKTINESKLIEKREDDREGDTKDDRAKITNLINSIQAGIASHYKEENQRSKIRTEILNFSNMDLKGVNLTDANLSDAILINADLRTANLTEADLSGAILINADLRRANLERANLSKTDLSEAKLGGANLSVANLQGSILYGTDLSGANLGIANLSFAKLNNADLSGADLRRANLEGANLSKTDLSGAKLGGANLRRAKLSFAKLNNAYLSGADLRGVDLTNANLSEAKLIQADLCDTDLSSTVGFDQIDFYYAHYNENTKGLSEETIKKFNMKKIS